MVNRKRKTKTKKMNRREKRTVLLFIKKLQSSLFRNRLEIDYDVSRIWGLQSLQIKPHEILFAEESEDPILVQVR